MPYFKIFFKVQKLANLRALLTRSETAILSNIFTSLSWNCDIKHACKTSFLLTEPNFPETWWREYVWVFGCIYCGRSPKTAILRFVKFLKTKNSRASFRLIFENSLPKGFYWQNIKKSVISILKINFRYLQSSGLKY